MKQFIYLGLFLFIFFSCKKENTDDTNTDAIEIQEDAKISSIGITLNTKAKKEVAAWDKFQLVQSKMEMYQSITNSQALLNAMELSELIQDASDTIDIALLDRPDLKIRFNVLYNHAFRLYDMSSIPSITEEEVDSEITGLLDAFSAVNDKINAIYTIEDLKSKYGNTTIDTAVYINDDVVVEDLKKNEETLIRSKNISSKSIQKGRVDIKKDFKNKDSIVEREE